MPHQAAAHKRKPFIVYFPVVHSLFPTPVSHPCRQNSNRKPRLRSASSNHSYRPLGLCRRLSTPTAALVSHLSHCLQSTQLSTHLHCFCFEILRMVEEEQVKREDSTKELSDGELEKLKAKKRKKRKRCLMKEAAKADKCGVCYLSRIPPCMDPLKLRQILSQFGEIERIWLTPEDLAAHVYRKKAGGFRGQGFTEGWVGFTNNGIAKRVAAMLNGEQIAYKNATREQKLVLELSLAKKERDFYLKKVDQSRALSHIDERLKKKRKNQQGKETGTLEIQGDEQVPKVIRQFPQIKPVKDDDAEKQKRVLSKDLLAGVFGGSS